MERTAQVGKHGVVVTTIEQSSPNRQAFHVLHLVLIGVLLATGIDRFMHLMSDGDGLIAQSIARRLPAQMHRLVLIEGGIEIALASLIGWKARAGGYIAAIWLAIFSTNLFMARQYELGLHGLTLAAVALAVGRMAAAYGRVTTELD